MKSRTLQVLVTALALLGGSQIGTGLQPTAEGQSQQARCAATVPRDWGEFRGATMQGFVFEDHNGTVRVIRNLPCPGVSTPQIAIQINRE